MAKCFYVTLGKAESANEALLSLACFFLKECPLSNCDTYSCGSELFWLPALCRNEKKQLFLYSAMFSILQSTSLLFHVLPNSNFCICI